MSNRKSPGISGTPVEAFKAMDKEVLNTFLDLVVDFWTTDLDFEAFHTMLLKLLPQKGDFEP
jgi:hypothetical protein